MCHDPLRVAQATKEANHPYHHRTTTFARGEAELAIRTAAVGVGAAAQVELYLLSNAPGRRRAAPRSR